MKMPTYRQLLAENQKFRNQLCPRSAWVEQSRYAPGEAEPQGDAGSRAQDNRGESPWNGVLFEDPIP